MTLYEEVFQKNRETLPKPVPVIIKFADSASVGISPVGSPSGTIKVITITDNALKYMATWQFGAWSGPPAVTPGADNLGVGFLISNTGAITGNFTLTITDAAGNILASKTTNNIPPGGTASVGWTGTMPPTAYTVNLSVTP